MKAGFSTKDYSYYNRVHRDNCIRPAVKLKNIPDTCKRNPINGVLETEYGAYPQTVVPKQMQKEIESAYLRNELEHTGCAYTVDGAPRYDYSEPFDRTILLEYEYQGEKYVCVRPCLNDCATVSTGDTYYENHFVWVKVEPVKWLIDEKQKIMFTEKLIVSGIQFNLLFGTDKIPFKNTELKKFMDTYLAKEILQHPTLSKTIPETDIKKQRVKNKNPYNLNFEQTKEEDIIRGALEGNVAIFLHGKPGCGKSDRVKQLDPDFIELNLTHLDPELLDGLAGEKDGKAVHIKPPWLEELEEKCKKDADEIHILFLEELTNASPMMQAKAYGIALDKKVAGRWKLPENARVVAAGNELEDSLVANEMAEPLYDRFAHVNIETTVENWLEWAVTPESYYERLEYKKEEEPKQKIHPAIYGYISYKGEEVLRTPYNREKPEPHADPRRWKMASDMLYATKNPNTLKAIVGEYITYDFIQFCKIPTITIEDILKGNYTEEDLEMNIGEKLATVYGLLKVDNENMPKVREFVQKLGAEICTKFEVQWANGNEERLEQLQELKLKEEEERKKPKLHKEEETKGMVSFGISAFKKIFGGYQEFLTKEENKDNQSRDKG